MQNTRHITEMQIDNANILDDDDRDEKGQLDTARNGRLIERYQSDTR